MNIRPIDVPDIADWPGCQRKVFGAPRGMEAVVEPAEVLIDLTPGETELHVAWQPDEIDLVRLAHGGTVWLTVLGTQLPPHRLEVRGGDR